MSFRKAFRTAIGRSVDMAKTNTAQILRMEVMPSAQSRGPKLIWQMTKQTEVDDMATGSDKDLGGLSSRKVDLVEGSPGKRAVFVPPKNEKVQGVFGDHTSESESEDSSDAAPKPTHYPEATHHGRFWGTLCDQVPRGAGLERAGYAAFRNRLRPTLFGTQTWDISLHSYLALRVRNNLFRPETSHIEPPNMSDLLEGTSSNAARRARSALGYGLDEPEGPKFFVNLQTDGPVTSDLFQHRLWLNPSKRNQWQTVIIPLDAFLLIKVGQISVGQVKMMKEGIRTVGISTVLEGPLLPERAKDQVERSQEEAAAGSSAAKRSNVAKYPTTSEDEEELERSRSQQQKQPLARRGAKRASSHRFDLAVAGVHAVGSIEEGMDLWSDVD